jgi:two-component system, OmpR family, phosphate regulon sensor histidine kinase PhoR
MSFRSLLVILCAGFVLTIAVALFTQDISIATGCLASFVAGAFLMRAISGRVGAATDEQKKTSPAGVVISANLVNEVDSSASGARRERALLEATMEGMREGVIVVDNQMRITVANRAANEIFNLRNEIGGARLGSRRLSELTRNPTIHAAFLAVIEGNSRRETKVEMHDNGRRVFDLRVAPLRSITEDKPSGAIGVFFDITRLERLERVRQEFLSNVSHELRTPLTAITTFIETLEAGAIDDADNNRRFLEIIRRNAARMHTLIDDILELSAIEAGTITVEPARVRLHDLVNDVLTTVATRASAQGIEIHNETSANAFVLADRRRLEQMLTNLVDNAIKFSAEGGAVTIRHERNGERDRITVSDTGEGIAPEHIERIFERFYRVDRARSRALGGTGLGLAIVKHLARAHGGEASVVSTLGQGSIFTIELPSIRSTDGTINSSDKDLLIEASLEENKTSRA